MRRTIYDGEQLLILEATDEIILTKRFASSLYGEDHAVTRGLREALSSVILDSSMPEAVAVFEGNDEQLVLGAVTHCLISGDPWQRDRAAIMLKTVIEPAEALAGQQL